MSASDRFSVHRWAVPFACILCGLSLTVVQSAAAAGRPAATIQAAPVQAATISTDLKHATGYSTAQLTTRPVCGAAAPGRIRCLAQLLTVKSTGKPVTLLHAPRPDSATTAATASAAPQEYTADFLQWAYDTTWLSANAGAGDTVAIVDAYGDSGAYSDMEQFRTANGLPQIPTCSTTDTTSCFEVVNQNGQTSSLPSAGGGWNIEESLDIDAVSSLCPLCNILVVEANNASNSNLDTAVSTAAALGANQISLSWGGDTSPDASAYESPYDSITGSAILAAAGDSSYPGPDVGYPAALADVTAVGGTSLTADSSTARGFDESAWAKQPCPAGGGTCGTESGCDTSQAVPTYQSGVTTDCSGRAYDDISADADPLTGLNIYDSQPGKEGCGTANNMCIVGGTSLATPLTAAIEALTGVSGATPAWTYSDSSLLNDIVSGSDGSCPSGEYLICNAGTGWDGPTGNGSISGDVAIGGPGIGGSETTGVNATDVTFAGGVYPNGESTTYDWSYWPSDQPSSIGTAPASPASISGSPLQAVSSSVCTLLPSTTYDYELTASNGSGSETSAQGSFTTAATGSAPTTSSTAAITGSAVTGQTLSGQVTWNDPSCNSAPGYQWQESSSSSGPWTVVGTGQTYALTAADIGKYLQFSSTESNGVGSSSSTSQVVGPVTTPTPTTTTPTVTTPTTTTPTTTTTSTTPTTTTTTSVRFYRCVRTCALIDTHGATTYKPTKADYGRYIKAVTTVTRHRATGTSASTSTRWIGPVTAATAGDVGIGSGARIASTASVRGSTGKALAQVRIARRRGNKLTLVVRRATRAPTQAWAYVVSKGARVSGTRIRSLERPLSLSVTLKRGQTIKLVAVRT